MLNFQSLEPLPTLTERQAELLLFIGQHFAVHRQCPPPAALRAYLAVGDRTNTEPYLRPLLGRGYLERTGRYTTRMYKLTALAIDLLERMLRDKEGTYDELQQLIQTVRSAQ